MVAGLSVNSSLSAGGPIKPDSASPWTQFGSLAWSWYVWSWKQGSMQTLADMGTLMLKVWIGHYTKLSTWASTMMYTLSLGKFIRNHSVNFHYYADECQLYLSIKSHETNELAKLQACLAAIRLNNTTAPSTPWWTKALIIHHS